MGLPQIDTGPMTVEEFYAFTDARPDGEKWELIDGEAVLNASPSRVIVFSRENGFEERRFRSDADVVMLDPPGVSLALADTYYKTGL